MLKNKTDIELYNDFLNGNNEAFGTIIKKYREMLILFIMRYVNVIDIAEDLAQDTFLYVFINKKEYDFKYSFKTYLYTIARCRSINYLKKSKRIIHYDEFEMNIESEEIDEKLIRNENKLKLYQVIKKLKREYQIVIYLKYIENLKYKEICKILNRNMSQVKFLIYCAKKRLKKLMEKEESLNEE
ncbi:MAG: RNA polymerase sigma factor [Clostridia bacterium]|nr:RNA polymerase sigma factor [Clostridia bacterium]